MTNYLYYMTCDGQEKQRNATTEEEEGKHANQRLDAHVILVPPPPWFEDF